ncbi:MAG: hypothetical protein NTW87_27320 [Planctomycetota bacterium]|nr:hypothetical protein [Planctomycetota bacterium]
MSADAQLWGDCHTHSTYSDGLFSVTELTRFYEAFGDDFRFQTDHLLVAVPEGGPAGTWLHASRWPEYCAACRSATTPRHVCLPGVELGWQVDADRGAREGWFHTKLYPPAGADGAPPALPDESFFGGKTYLELLARAKAEGLRPVVAHIDQGAPLERMSGAEICGLEAAVVSGRSYLSGTFHGDCYAAAGWPAHPNRVAGGQTHFSPWWDFPNCAELRDRPARDLVVQIFEAALRSGRCRPEDYPLLRAFTVNGKGSGQDTSAGAKAEIVAAWRTHLPVRIARLIADGTVAAEIARTHPAFGQTEGELRAVLDLRGKHYVRLEIEAAEPGDEAKRESLVANPVYLIN